MKRQLGPNFLVEVPKANPQVGRGLFASEPRASRGGGIGWLVGFPVQLDLSLHKLICNR